MMLAALGAATLMTSPLAAQTRPGFEIGTELVDYRYRERADGSVIVRDKGTMGKLRASYVETIGATSFLRAIYDVGSGKIDYRADDGTRLDNVEQTVGQLELHIGKDFALGRATLTAFTGIGGRALLDESGGRVSSSGTFGYDRTISYAFLPLGISATLPAGASRLLLSGQFNQVLRGTAESELSDAGAELPNLKLPLRGGHGFEASGLVAFGFGRREIRFGPVLRHWRLERSRSRTFTEPEGSITFFEPASRTTELSVRLSLAF
jgi:hypothetical protein